jgi:hypothetical protein
MAISVNFRTQSRELDSRSLPLNEGVSVYGKVTGLLGIGEPFQLVRFELGDRFQETRTNAFGDYAFFFRTPNTRERATIRLTTFFTVGGVQSREIPVAYGISPSPLRAEENRGLFDMLGLSRLGDYVGVVLIGLAGYAVYRFHKSKIL